jgi:hypothetical protein
MASTRRFPGAARSSALAMRGGQDSSICQMVGKRLKGDAGGKARTAPQSLDKGGDVAFVGDCWNLERRRLRGAVSAICGGSLSPDQPGPLNVVRDGCLVWGD